MLDKACCVEGLPSGFVYLYNRFPDFAENVLHAQYQNHEAKYISTSLVKQDMELMIFWNQTIIPNFELGCPNFQL